MNNGTTTEGPTGKNVIHAANPEHLTDKQSQTIETQERVVLHWMQESDVAMHNSSGVATPTLCGAWVEPDQQLAAQITSGRDDVRYVSCKQCDLLATIPGAMTA